MHAAVTSRILSGWFNFELTAKDISLSLQGKVYAACVRSCMLHGSEIHITEKRK